MKNKEELIDKYFKPNFKSAIQRKDKVEYLDYQANLAYTNLGKNLHYLIFTYGCIGNSADSETIKGILDSANFQETKNEHEADIFILNTCAIREGAEDRVWGELGRLKKYLIFKPQIIFILAGCMSQEENTIKKVLAKYNHVDIILGTHNLYKILDYLHVVLTSHEKVIEVFSYEGAVFAHLPKKRLNNFKVFVEIMFGCDEFCTYCIVPYTRGKERSRKKEDILEEITRLIENGAMEVNLLGQNVNSYGKDLYENYSFGDLLQDIARLHIPRIRFMTSHPHDLDLKTILAIKNHPQVMPHFHLPVQSGSNHILQKMNRHYTKEEYIDLVTTLRQYVPKISITTDIIVGFAGEQEADFLETIDLVKKVGFDGAYTFMYSVREGTPAAKFSEQVDNKIKNQRLQVLMAMTNEGSLSKNLSMVGHYYPVLVESISNKGNLLCGYTPDYRLVNFAGSDQLIGKIVQVKIIKAKTWFLLGELDEQP
ncbi:MAG: tRNA (N6-isopentenyl adenosine(37)-C2)-methylthiotransferase MiaB [Acholeplasmatales bacterium]|jgi:tRNA-2-methylthio-N6-dimethylallyladenosine synthase|nr:tRNA (N6-isopentenyl adenosine(37)-C2)-methylthiotransferase MiaB [Acholeplasmatales bacterium]